MLALASSGAASTDPFDLVPGTAVLADNFGSGGNGGNTSSTTSSTNIFSPSVFVDYKRFGGEPTVTVDRYPFTSNVTIDNKPLTCTTSAPCFPDLTYASAPQGFAYPHYSPFWKSVDLGETFRLPTHVPAQGQNFATGGGGGDTHQVTGQLTHRIFYADLPGPGCVTVNISGDFGETWHSNQVGCGLNPGAIDDRQWIEADEFGTTQNVYLTFINFSNAVAPSIGFAKSTDDGETYFSTGCNTITSNVPTTPSACPDPLDTRLQVAGPIVADKNGTATRPPTHALYVPFVRGGSEGGTGQAAPGPPWELWIAKSTNYGDTWVQRKVADLGQHNPVNLFPQLTIDRSGNLYVTWSQTQQGVGDVAGSNSSFTGEQDVYYAFSTAGGETWSPPIPLTQEANDSAVMPWMVAGDAGRVDLVYYKANNGVNSNVSPPGTVWNVYFAQSLNALNTGSNFKTVQISDHPNHLAGICTAGLACSGDRDLLDFFTVDLDHLGAANVIWADDNTTRGSDTRNKFSRQLSGVSVFKNQTINLMNTWPIKDHSVIDTRGDTINAAGMPNGSCSPMDVLGASANRNGDLVTIGITVNGLPDSTGAKACGGGAATGGIWGAEFWASSPGDGEGYGESFYVAYRDNPPDGPPRVEAGRMSNVNATITSLEFQPEILGTGGQCAPADPLDLTPASGTCTVTQSCTSTPPISCTLTMTVSANLLGIKSGSGMYSISGLAAYQGGSSATPVVLRVELGNSEQADVAAPFDINGTGTTTN